MGRRWGDRVWGLVAAFAVGLGSLAYVHHAQPWFSGDEPHYAVYARSLGEGWGLDLERAHRAENAEPFVGGPLQPHGDRYAGPDGRLASWHGIGLPLVLAPAMAIHPTPWTARHVMIGISALVAYHLFRFVRRAAGCRQAVAAGAVVAVMLAPPTIFYNGLVFPELAATLLLVLALRGAMAREGRRWALPAASAAAGALVWLGPRYGLLTAGLVLTFVIAELRSSAAANWRDRVPALVGAAAPAAVFVLALVAFNLELYGSVIAEQNLDRPNSRATAYYEPGNLYIYGVGALVGFPSGLVPFAPLLVVPITALGMATRVLGRGVTAAGLTALAYFGFNAFFGSPGFCPPGRYLVTVVPLLAVPFAVVVEQGRWVSRAAIAGLGALTVLSVWTSTADFNRIFGGNRAGFEPIGATADLWPIALEDRRPGGWHGVAADLVLGTGSVRGDSVVAVEGSQDPGTVVYGPYEYLSPGTYEVGFALRNPGEDPTGYSVDVHSPDLGLLANLDAELPASSEEVVTLRFATDGNAPLEFRVWWYGSGTLEIDRVDAESVAAVPGRRTEDEWPKSFAWGAVIIGAALLWSGTARDRAGDAAADS